MTGKGIQLVKTDCCLDCSSITLSDFVGDETGPTCHSEKKIAGVFCVGKVSADTEKSATLSATKSARVNSTLRVVVVPMPLHQLLLHDALQWYDFLSGYRLTSG